MAAECPFSQGTEFQTSMCLPEKDFHMAASLDDFTDRLAATKANKHHGTKPVVKAPLSMPLGKPTLLPIDRNQKLLRFRAIKVIAMMLHVTLHALIAENVILLESLPRRLALQDQHICTAL